MTIEITKVSARGQVVIPYEIRESKGLKVGEKLVVYEAGESIILQRVQTVGKDKSLKSFEDFFSSLHKKSEPLTRAEIVQEIATHRSQKKIKGQ